MRLVILLLPLLAASCAYAQPSPIGTHCVNQGRNPIPVCTNG